MASYSSKNLATAYAVMATSPSSANGTLSPTSNSSRERPNNANRSLTAPDRMAMNGHFAGVGQNGKSDNFEHGIQVIDEDKEFKYAE